MAQVLEGSERTSTTTGVRLKEDSVPEYSLLSNKYEFFLTIIDESHEARKINKQSSKIGCRPVRGVSFSNFHCLPQNLNLM